MKILFENKLTESYVEMFEDALDSVPDIDVKMIDWFFEHPAQMEDFVSSKLQHLYDDEEFDEDMDVSNKPKTVGYNLAHASDEFLDKINSLLSDAEYKIKSFNQVKREVIDLINNENFNIPESQKKTFISRLMQSPSPRAMQATIAGYWTGMSSISTKKRQKKGY